MTQLHVAKDAGMVARGEKLFEPFVPETNRLLQARLVAATVTAAAATQQRP